MSDKIEFHVSRTKAISTLALLLGLVAIHVVLAIQSENGMIESIGKWFDFVLLGIAILIFFVIGAQSMAALNQKGPVFTLTEEFCKYKFGNTTRTMKWEQIQSVYFEKVRSKKWGDTSIMHIKTDGKPIEFSIQELKTDLMEIKRAFTKFGGDDIFN